MKQLSFSEFIAAGGTDAYRLIDVREQDEWDAVHAQGAEHFPLSRIRQGDLPEQSDGPIAVICAAGGRSAMACQVFGQSGWSDLTNISDGTNGAIAAGEDHLVRG